MLIWCKLSWLCSIQWSSSNCDQLKAVPLFYLRWWKAEPFWVWMCGGYKFHLLAFYLLWVGRGHWNGYVVFSLPSPGKCYGSVSAAALLCAGEHLLLYRWGAKELACCFTDKERNQCSVSRGKQAWTPQDAAPVEKALGGANQRLTRARQAACPCCWLKSCADLDTKPPN